MPRPLAEQVVVLTGASSGIGRAAAGLFGERGASVVLAARDADALREVAREVELAGGRALAVPTDVGDWPQVEALARAAVDHFGRIDTWVNDAGVAIGGTVEATEVAEVERIFRVNVLGVIHGVKAALPYMTTQRAGTIINVGSVAGVRAFPIQSVYSATKHAVKGLTEGLRLELWKKDGDFHVTYIAPAAINTPLFAESRTKFGHAAADLRPADRRRVDRLRRREPPPRHLRRRRRQDVRRAGANQPRPDRLADDPYRQDLPRPDHRPAARRTRQPLRAAPGRTDSPRRLRRPDASHELVLPGSSSGTRS